MFFYLLTLKDRSLETKYCIHTNILYFYAYQSVNPPKKTKTKTIALMHDDTNNEHALYEIMYIL
jgi:hypothetical protein